MTHILTVAPSALPSLPLAERADLPDAAAIYFVLAGDRLLRRRSRRSGTGTGHD